MIDRQRIIDALLALEVGGLARERGAALVDHWIEENAGDAEKRIVGVEMGFVAELAPQTFIIGVQDLLTDEGGFVGNEWKTTKEKTKYWNEDAWVASISSGSQVAIYALAARIGTYYERGREPLTPCVERPRIRVRAISKSQPPVVWPQGKDLVLKFADKELEFTHNALITKAASIRAMRKTELVPYQLPGIWCTNQFRRTCELYEACTRKEYPVGWAPFQPSDPAAALALEHVPDYQNPEVVVLGASAYASASECLEKYRQNGLGLAHEESVELDIGSSLHAGCAEWYRQIREQQ